VYPKFNPACGSIPYAINLGSFTTSGRSRT
jgi:hypothetical protein